MKNIVKLVAVACAILPFHADAATQTICGEVCDSRGGNCVHECAQYDDGSWGNGKHEILPYYPAMLVGVGGGALLGAGAHLLFQRGRDSSWNWGDTAAELAVASVTALDVSQTMWFRARGAEEMNPLLGSTPSDKTIILGAAGALFFHATVAYLLPRPYREIWQGIGFGVEFMGVLRNHSTGVCFSTPW